MVLSPINKNSHNGKKVRTLGVEWVLHLLPNIFVAVYRRDSNPRFFDLTREECRIWGAHIPARLVEVVSERVSSNCDI